MLRRNLIANGIGQGWSAVMGLLFVPVYIRYLGIEAYGLIGVFAVMQAWLALLDAGMTPTLNREMARFSAGARDAQSIHNLLRSIELICFCVATLIATAVWYASDIVANHWLRARELPVEKVANALSLMGLVVALRFCESIYAGSLIGLQQQIRYNTALVLLSTLRHGGAVVVLVWLAPTIEAFFFWQAAVSLLAVAVLCCSVHRLLPSAPAPARFSRESLADVWQFAAGMMGITLLGLMITQIDKILLSQLLPLDEFGYYALAAAVAGVMFLLIQPVNHTVYPRMVALATSADTLGLAGLYHLSAQLVSVITAPTAALLVFYADGVIFTWSGDAQLAARTGPVLAVLAFGTFLHSLLWMPYQLQLAHGWTRLALISSTVAVTILVPAILCIVPRHGSISAAWIWVVLNAVSLVIMIQLMHRRLLPKEKARWYLADMLLPSCAAFGVVLFARLLQPDISSSQSDWLLFLLTAGTIALMASALSADYIRQRLRAVQSFKRHNS